MSFINADKTHLWKEDVERSIDFYNDWFIRFAPETFRKQRERTSGQVIFALEVSDYLRQLTPERLIAHPGILPVLRMAAAPPLARDRLVGLAHVSKTLINAMEGSEVETGRIPPRMPKQRLSDELGRICDLLMELADGDLFTWLENGTEPTKPAIERASVVVADRLCGAASDPIIRNAQERRQLDSLKKWLTKRKYRFIPVERVVGFGSMEPGTFTFRLNVPVGEGETSYNIPVDCAIQPLWATTGDMPLLMEAKSAGDFTNTNKRRKEEAQKIRQLRERYGANVRFLLLLCGYFGPDYLGYEAAEGIDWVWEHRLNDLAQVLKDPSAGSTSVVEDPAVAYVPNAVESLRLKQQVEIDGGRSAMERNQMGQFATPLTLAVEVVERAVGHLESKETVRMLEPSCGTGAFFSALRLIAPTAPHFECTGVEVDALFANAAKELWGGTGVVIEQADFLEFSARVDQNSRFDLLCANPPYVRHHHMSSEQKRALQARVASELQLASSGLTGLYVYFILLSHSVLAEGAVASWLIPSEFLVVNYGRVLREYLTKKVQLIEVFQFDPEGTQFGDALVSSCIVTYRKTAPRADHKVLLRFGTSMRQASSERTTTSGELASGSRWHMLESEEAQPVDEAQVSVGDLFKVRRGIATGANDFFILTREQVREHDLPNALLRPVFTSPRQLENEVIEADVRGTPLVKEPLYLLDSNMPLAEIGQHYPTAHRYLEEGREAGVANGYLCKSRDIWYQQEKREPAPFLLSYMGRSTSKRSSPFRFFLNRSRAIATNGFLCLYPKPAIARLLQEDPRRELELLELLNSISAETLKRGGRSYGGGLQKVEPNELLGLPIPARPDWLVLEEQLTLV
ncbi:MAG: XamI family restriction endonuclease [Flavobacteriales bacterium]|nr:XamI family restriction endonuclease [Flavobacteriales bacterium]MCC6937713.1 XamI family restriction endonuclease [Flavobacteriales bacterium]